MGIYLVSNELLHKMHFSSFFKPPFVSRIFLCKIRKYTATKNKVAYRFVLCPPLLPYFKVFLANSFTRYGYSNSLYSSSSFSLKTSSYLLPRGKNCAGEL